MPFFVFKISSGNKIEYIDEEEKYRPAREKLKKLRATHTEDDGATYRMIFANSIGQGEILLSPTESNDKIIGDD